MTVSSIDRDAQLLFWPEHSSILRPAIQVAAAEGRRVSGMARNIEIKARVDDLAAVRAKAQLLSASEPETLVQHDTFYRTPTGRLKLREFADGSAELIYYERPDQPGPKTSTYTRTPVPEPRSMDELLRRLSGQLDVVTKRREIFLVGSTRIHLDNVDGLGSFVELEVVLSPEQTEADGEAIAADLIGKLGIQRDALVAGAYVDLLRR